MRRLFVLGAGLALGACELNAAGSAVPDEASAIEVSGQGIGWNGSGASMLISFGATQSEIEELLVADLQNRPATASNEECGAGPMQFSTFDNGLVLNFQDGEFVGWFLDGESPVKTDKGVRTGDPIGSFASAHGAEEMAESTLGIEYYSSAEGIGALAGENPEDARVEALYAGTQCFFR
uniref:hypothetical protein n=1 Tax=Parerythrobacter lutipelagi TaxID=1964208 RepID=UPI0010F99BC6|nr:hypothetical protein [Parerythrobacter lutipelagi]